MTTKIKIVTEINLRHLKKKIKKKKCLRKHKMPPCCKLQKGWIYICIEVSNCWFNKLVASERLYLLGLMEK